MLRVCLRRYCSVTEVPEISESSTGDERCIVENECIVGEALFIVVDSEGDIW